MDDEFDLLEASASSSVHPRWQGTITNELNNRWQFVVYPDACQVEVMDATGRRSITFAINDRSILNVGAMIFRAMQELSEPRQSYFGPGITEVKRRG